jgi:hypothetical protein
VPAIPGGAAGDKCWQAGQRRSRFPRRHFEQQSSSQGKNRGAVKMTPERIDLVLNLSMILGAMAIVFAICGTTVVAMAIHKIKSEDHDPIIIKTFFTDGTLLQMIIAPTVVFSALALRILDLISSDAVISILSAIAGYVFAGLSRRKSPE